ncbi:MAG: diguanylate cyclase [Planctomycetota bacterium]|nr:diguanylate cyclase [Planctomycetota bacterium]
MTPQTMSGFPTVNFSGSDQGLFTPNEIRRLMRIEFDRAVRYEYPIVCLQIEVDRLESLHDLYGYESKEEILDAVIELLRTMTRASDFLGCMRDDRILAMFPHTERAVAAKLAERLLHGARRLRFDSDGRTLRTTLSIGVSYREPSEVLGYEEFTGSAEEALRLAVEGGGDRFVERKRLLRKELGELRTDIEAATIAIREDRHAALRRVGAPDHEPWSELDLPEGELNEKIRQLFSQLGERTPELARLERDIVALTLKNLQLARDEALESQLAERNQEIETLERRVRKLAGILNLTEAELQRVMQMKEIDPGIASIYRAVQGLSPQERDFELKKQLMTEIYRANLELQRHRAG